MTQTDQLQSIIARVLPEIIETRRHLHQNPELSHQEEKTSALVAEKLRGLGLDTVLTEVGGHGVVGELRGEGDGPIFALRADMDALPIQETNDLPYKSCNAGVMHACGHDGHTATLLGTASVLSKMRDQFKGTVRFLFQPAEETVGGAVNMCAAGVMDDVSAIVALHGWPNLEVGQIGVRTGPMMASADTFDITVRGRGGHAAYPQTSVDPIVIGAEIIQNLQSIVSREISPTDAVVVTVAQFHAGTAYNIIPDVAEMKGTVRCLSNTVRATMPGRLERIANGVCAAHGATCTFQYREGTLVVVNDARITSLVAEAGAQVLGPDGVQELPSPTMGAEDFSYYLEYAPGAMFRLGVGTDVTPLHTPTYNFGDGPLKYGMGVLTGVALNYLKK